MPKVTFSDEGGREVEAEPDEPLITVCKKNDSKLVFGCEAGVCGTCMINVLEGAGNLSAPEDQEKDSLIMFSAKEGQRLACQCKVKGDVKIEKATDI
ncbi:MAG: 2Fe-2S iron-sulfur cluster-binding protein [archaeon]